VTATAGRPLPRPWSLEDRDGGCGAYCLTPSAPWPFVRLLCLGDPDVRGDGLPAPHGSYRTPAVPAPRTSGVA
jgi:hypothetical protein